MFHGSSEQSKCTKVSSFLQIISEIMYGVMETKHI